MKGPYEYKNSEDFAEKCRKALEIHFKSEIPMPKNNIKRKSDTIRRKQELPKFF